MSGLQMSPGEQRQVVITELKQKARRLVSFEVIATVDNSNQPNMIYSSRGGSFVRNRQNRLMMAASGQNQTSNEQRQGQGQINRSRPASYHESMSQDFGTYSRQNSSSTTSSLRRNSSKSSDRVTQDSEKSQRGNSHTTSSLVRRNSSKSSDKVGQASERSSRENSSSATRGSIVRRVSSKSCERSQKDAERSPSIKLATSSVVRRRSSKSCERSPRDSEKSSKESSPTSSSFERHNSCRHSVRSQQSDKSDKSSKERTSTVSNGTNPTNNRSSARSISFTGTQDKSHGETPKDNSSTETKTTLTRSNSRSSLKSYEMPTASSSARSRSESIGDSAKEKMSIDFSGVTCSRYRSDVDLKSVSVERQGKVRSKSSSEKKARKTSKSSIDRPPTPPKSKSRKSSKSSVKSQKTPTASRKSNNVMENESSVKKTSNVNISTSEYQSSIETLPPAPLRSTASESSEDRRKSSRDSHGIYGAKPSSDELHRFSHHEAAHVDTKASLSSSFEIDNRIRSTTSNDVLDYLNTALKGYTTSGTSASEMANNSHDSYDSPTKENPTSEGSVFSYSHRSSIVSLNSRTARSGSDTDSDLSSQGTHSYDVSGSRRVSSDDENSLQRQRTSDIVATPDKKRRRKRGKKEQRTPPKVEKYRENVKTIRQQIKPGTVGDLTHLFDSEADEERRRRISSEYVQSEQETNYQGGANLQIDINKTNESNFDYLSASKAMIEQARLKRGDSLRSIFREKRDSEQGEFNIGLENRRVDSESVLVTSPYRDETDLPIPDTRILSSSSRALYADTGSERAQSRYVKRQAAKEGEINYGKFTNESRVSLRYEKESREDNSRIDSRPLSSRGDRLPTRNFGSRSSPKTTTPLAGVATDDTSLFAIFASGEAEKNANKSHGRSQTGSIDTRRRGSQKSDILNQTDTWNLVTRDLGAVEKNESMHKKTVYKVTSVSPKTGDQLTQYIVPTEPGENFDLNDQLPERRRSRPSSVISSDEVMPSESWENTDAVVLSQQHGEDGTEGEWQGVEITKTSGAKDEHLWESMSVRSTGSARSNAATPTNFTSWTTVDDIENQGAMIDHGKKSGSESSSSHGSSSSSDDEARETIFVPKRSDENNNDDNNQNGDETRWATTNATTNTLSTGSGSTSLTRTASNRDVKNKGHDDSDGRLFMSKTEQEIREERAAYDVISQLPTHLPSQTTGVNLFAHGAAGRTAERRGKESTSTTDESESDSDDEERENEKGDEGGRKEKRAEGAGVVSGEAYLSQNAPAYTWAQVEKNETNYSSDKTYPVQAGVPRSDDFNAILSELELNGDSDSNCPSSVHSRSDQRITHEDNLIENRSNESASMKRKKKEKKSFSKESNRGEVVNGKASVEKDSVAVTDGLVRLNKTISDDEKVLGTTSGSLESIEDEIRELHLQLSPRSSNNVVEEKTFKLAQNIHSNQGSLSSQSSTVREQTVSRETVFNSEFFSGSQIKEETSGSDWRLTKDGDDIQKSSSSSTSTSRSSSPDILDRREGSITNDEKASLPSPVFDTYSSDPARENPSLTQRNLPVNKEETDRPISRGSHRLTFGETEEERKDGEYSDSDSSKSASENEDGVKSSDKRRRNSWISVESFNDITEKRHIFSEDNSVQKSGSAEIKGDNLEAQRSRRSSLSSKSSSSDSDGSASSSDSDQSKNRKRRQRNRRLFEILNDSNLSRSDSFKQEYVRSKYIDNDQITPAGPFPNADFGTNRQYMRQREIREGENRDMAAIVGEVSSFNIHRKMTSIEESSTVPQDRSSASQMQTVPGERGGNSDVYLIQDKKGDVFALQEVGTANNTREQSVTTMHTVNRDDYSGSQAAPVQPVSFSGSNYPRDQGRTDIFVDSSSVNDDKAREVITAYLNAGSSNKSLDSAVSRGSSSSYTHSHSRVDTDHSRRLDVSRDGRGTVIVNNTVPSQTASSPHSIVVHQGANEKNFLNNSTITVNQEVNAKADTSQTWDVPGYEPYTSGSGGEQNYKTSLMVTNVNTPQQQTLYTISNQPSVVDTSFDSQQSNTAVNAPHTTYSAFTPLNANVNQGQTTRPITIQTTTNAVVGEKVDMTIDFPRGQQTYQPQNVTASAELGTSSSDDESKSRYVIRSVPTKSSLKKGSVYTSSNTSFDSNPEVFYTKKETITGEIVLGGKKSGSITLDTSRDAKNSTIRAESLSPSSADSSMYMMRQGSDRGRETSRRNQNHDASYEINRSKQTSGAQKMHKVSKRTIKHHSPERIFKNPTLSLRKFDIDKSDSSDEEKGGKQYRTITRVVIDGDGEDKSRSSSSSPTNGYRVSSNHSSFNRSQENVQTSQGKSYQVLRVNSQGQDDSASGSFSETESELDISKNRRRYKVISKSDMSIDRHAVRAHSSPYPEPVNSTSFEEAVIHRTKKVQPSRYQPVPSSSKSHKTVIQLEVGNQNSLKEKSRTESQSSNHTSLISRAKSMDSIDGRRSYVLSPPTGLNTSQSRNKSWRSSKTRSTDSSSEGSSSDLEGSGPYNLSSSRLVKTSKQKKGGKTYVVNSTIDDTHQHPTGYFKSTIDINEEAPSQNVSLKTLKTTRDQQSFGQQEKIKREEQRNSYTTEEKAVYYVRQESKPVANHVTKFKVHPSPDSGQGTEIASSDGENETHRQKFERVERIYEVKTEPMMPEQFREETTVAKDLRVLRGKILIKNRLDSEHVDDDFDQNVNIFDNSFHMDKDNPMYSSDREEEEDELVRQINQDITFDQVNKIAHRQKSRTNLEVSPKPRRKQSLSTLLLAKLANVDSQDIRQTIDVQHHNEEIFGNIDFIHADGEHTGSQNTSNFDSVSERVELTLQQGKAFVIIKVIAERIVPTDYEFNVWRKSQAIVTRQIEVDLLANDQRRRFYNHVMDTQGMPEAVEYVEGSGAHHDQLTSHEKQLSSLETLKLFSQILDVADGQGDQDHTSMRTKQEMGQISGADLLY